MPPGHPPVGHFLCPLCGFGYSRTGPDRAEADRFRIGRLEHFGPVWMAALERVWSDATVNLSEAARRLGVDLKTVRAQAGLRGFSGPKPGSRAGSRPLIRERVAPAPPTDTTALLRRHRQAWRRAIAADATAGAKAVRATVPGTYAWLYRHDRAWLYAHRPALKKPVPGEPRVDWSARDRRIARAVAGAAEQLRTSPDRPRWITRTYLGRLSGNLTFIEKYRDKLPDAEAALMALVETREGFALRRLAWAARLYQAAGISPARSVLVNRATLSRVADWPIVAAAIDETLLDLANPPSITAFTGTLRVAI